MTFIENFKISYKWSAFSFFSGAITYYFFRRELLRILATIVIIECLLFIVNFDNWFLIQRYLLNVFYLLGYLAMFILVSFIEN